MKCRKLKKLNGENNFKIPGQLLIAIMRHPCSAKVLNYPAALTGLLEKEISWGPYSLLIIDYLLKELILKTAYFLSQAMERRNQILLTPIINMQTKCCWVV